METNRKSSKVENKRTYRHPQIDGDNPPEDYTCHYCKESGSCPYAYDDYNLNGDCLAEK